MVEFIEVYTYIPDCTEVEKFKVLVKNIQIIYPFPKNETTILDNKTIKIKHQSILKIKDFNQRVYSDIPYEEFGAKRKDDKWIYPSNRLPKEREQVIVQLDLDKIENIFHELDDDDIQNLLHDKNNTYIGHLLNGYWEFKRQCFYDNNYNKDDNNNDDGIFTYYANQEKDNKEWYNQIVLKWRYFPKGEKEEEQLITRFDLMDL